MHTQPTRIALLLGLCCAATLRADEKATVPQGVRLTLEVDNHTHFLGENVLVHLLVENTGNKPFRIDLGGDYRGASRQLRFRVEAFDEQGRPVPDPDPYPNHMGGLSWGQEIKPGEKHYESLPLMRYRRFEKPGVYRVRVSHDFGWKETDPSKFPAAEATLKMVMPTEKQARQVVEQIYQLGSSEGGAGKRRKPYADFSTLIYPPYLAPLAERATLSDERALEALGSMPLPGATRVLVELLGHKDAAFALKAAQTLNLRLPDPQLQNKIEPRGPFHFDYLHKRRWLVEQSWRDELAPEVRKAGRALLEKKDLNSTRCGAYVLQCLGKAEDVPSLVKALDRAVALAAKAPLEKDVYPRPRGACQELTRAAQCLAQRGVPVPEKPRSAGELVLFACALAENGKSRPRGWEEVLATALAHELPYVREVALIKTPMPVPKAVLEKLAGLVRDKDLDVQIAACGLVQRAKPADLREPVLAMMRTAREHWQFHAANNAAWALGAHAERLRILVARLDEEGMTSECLSYLVDSVLSDTGGYGRRTDIDVATGRACKKAWEAFLETHGERLAGGHRFKLPDRSLPLAELFPTFEFGHR